LRIRGPGIADPRTIDCRSTRNILRIYQYYFEEPLRDRLGERFGDRLAAVPLAALGTA
jgi:hypothetical protein